MGSTRERRSGHTLLEVMVASGILAALLGATVLALDSGTKSASQATLISNLRTRERDALARIVRELKQSGWSQIFYLPAPNADATYPQTTPSLFLATAPQPQSAVIFKVCLGAWMPSELPPNAAPSPPSPAPPGGAQPGDPKFELDQRGFRLAKIPDPRDPSFIDGYVRFRSPRGASPTEIDIVDHVAVSGVNGATADGFGMTVLDDARGKRMQVTLELRQRDPHTLRGAPIWVRDTATFVVEND